LTVEPHKTRRAFGQWCSQCKSFTEDLFANESNIGAVCEFTCPKCRYESHPTMTTHEVQV